MFFTVGIKTPFRAGQRAGLLPPSSCPFSSALDTGLGQLAFLLAPNYGDPGILGGDPFVPGPAANLRPVDDPVAAGKVRKSIHMKYRFAFLVETRLNGAKLFR